MKLRSIALAGLLGAGLVMTSGCGTDDVVDAVNDLLKINVIHLANGTSAPVDFAVTSIPDETVGSMASTMVVVEGNDNYTVTAQGASSESFAKDSAHLYALCSSGSVITDSATGGDRQIEVINLSGNIIDAGSGQTLAVTLYDASDAVLASASLAGQTLAACSREALSFPAFSLSAVKTVGVNDVNYTVPAYDSDVAAKIDQLNNVDFDLVVFDPNAQKGTIVPLATAAELGKAAN